MTKRCHAGSRCRDARTPGAGVVMRDWKRSRFDDSMEDPQTSLVNLVDIMLVFICGLVVALVSAQRQSQALSAQAQSQSQVQAQDAAGAGVKQIVEKGRELPEMPEGLRGQTSGEGMQPVGQVFRDPKTGKLILVGQ